MLNRTWGKVHSIIQTTAHMEELDEEIEVSLT